MTTSIPTTTNPVATPVNTGIKVAGGTLVEVVEQLILADAPFLALPIIKQIWVALFNWVASYFIKAAETGATFTIIDLQVDKEVSGLSAALAAVIEAEKSGDPNAIKAAIQRYADAHSALVHDDGSSRAQ